MRTHTARAALFTAALALAACSNAGADGEAPTLTSGSTSGTVAGTSSSAGASGGSTASTTTDATTGGSTRATSTSSRPHVPATTPVEEHDQGVAWVPFGPATSNVPAPQPRYYGGLYGHDCDHSVQGGDDFGENQQHLYEGALAACLAVADNAAGNWATAQDQLAKVTPGGLDCLDSQTLRLLQQLVAAHRRHPDTAPATHASKQGSACPTKITGVEIIHDGGGGVKVLGKWLWGVSSATIGKVAAPIVETDPDGVIINPGAPLEPGTKPLVTLVQGNLPPQTVTLTVPAAPPSSSSAPATP